MPYLSLCIVLFSEGFGAFCVEFQACSFAPGANFSFVVSDIALVFFGIDCCYIVLV